MAELLYDYNSKEMQFQESHGKLNADQAAAFTAITGVITADLRRAYFFLQGPAGTSKTFLWRCLCSYYRSRGQVVLCVASLGIAALLLPGGRTAHSCF